MEEMSDVMEEILLKSDAKDLVSWKRVCKSWYSLLSDPRFVKSHLANIIRSAKPARVAMPTYWKIPHERLYQFNRWHVVGSSNGLVCIFPRSGDPLIVVINPCTTDLRILPLPPLISEKSGTGTSALSLGFAYDSPTDDYKVFIGIRKHHPSITIVQVLSLKSNTWKFIGQFDYYLVHARPGILFNGKLHWFAIDYHNPSQSEKVILSFDLSREEFKVIPPPNIDSNCDSLSFVPSLGILDDQISLFFNKRRTTIPAKIWVMRTYGVEHSWQLLPDNYKMKEHEVVYHLKMLEYLSPMNKSATFVIDDSKCLSSAAQYITTYRYVPSLVSPYAGRPTHTEHNNTSFQAWVFTGVVGEDGQRAMVKLTVIDTEQERRRIEEVYGREVGETENVFVHEDEGEEIEEIQPRLEGVMLCAERG